MGMKETATMTPLPMERAVEEVARPGWDGGNNGYDSGMGGEEDRRGRGRVSSGAHDGRAPAKPYHAAAGVRRRLQLLARQGKTSASRLQRNGYYKQLQKYSIARFDRAISGLSVSLLALALLIIRFGQRKGRFVHHLYAFTFLFLPLPLLFFLDLALVVALLL